MEVSDKFRNSATLILNEMLIWKNVKYGDFLDQSQSFRFSQITLGTKKNYVVIGPVWPRTKLWTIYYEQFASYVSRTSINGSFRGLCNPRPD